MGVYYLFYKKNLDAFVKISKYELVQKLKNHSDYHEWLYWTQGLKSWKLVSQSPEIFEWLSNEWDQNQSVPNLPETYSASDKLFANPISTPVISTPVLTKKSESDSEPFEVFEFEEPKSIEEPKTFQELKEQEPNAIDMNQNVGKILDFDKSIKDSYIDSSDNFKIFNPEPNVSEPSDLAPNTIPDNARSNMEAHFDEEKTHTGSHSNERFENTVSVEMSPIEITQPNFKINSNNHKDNVPYEEFENSKEFNPEEFSEFTPNHEDKVITSFEDKKHMRRYPRMKARLRTIITNKAKAFMTFTKDISLGGIQIENMIPKEILNSEIEVYLSDPSGKKSILFRCHPVGDMSNPCRFSFSKADEKNLQKLSQWLDDIAKAA